MGYSFFSFLQDLVFLKQASHVDLTPLTTEVRRNIREAYSAEDLDIFALSCYTNLPEPDEDEWSKNLEYLRALIHGAHDLGTNTVVTETGAPGVGGM